MLKQLKSYFFLQKLFTYLIDKTKLKLAKYNKNLQAELGLKFINYQLFTRNYIIYESKTKGKEYSWEGHLIYEGEYLKGEKHGKGKEYYYYGNGVKFDGQFRNGKKWTGKCIDRNGVIIYEIKGGKGHLKEYDHVWGERLKYDGEYLNGFKNGKAKEYNTGNSCLKYEGGFYNGVRHGKCKLYNCYATLKYEGEFFYGKKWTGKGYEPDGKTVAYKIKDGKGFIKQYYNSGDKIKYESEYLNGEIHGRGKEYYDDYNNTIKFKGEFLNGKKWNGYLYTKNKVHEIKNGKEVIYENNIDEIESFIKYRNVVLDGKKREYSFTNKLEFEGEYSNGKRNGKGKEYYDNGILRYEGEFFDNERNGYGKEYNGQGQLMFEGEYLYGQKRKGKEYINQILEYKGDYLFDKKFNGKGFDKKGNILYELKNGRGTLIEYDCRGNVLYKGECLNGKRHGKGREYNEFSGVLEYEGEFVNGERVKSKY